MANSDSADQTRAIQPFAMLGIAWFIAVGADFALGCLSAGSAVRNLQIPFTARLALVCTNAIAVGIVVLSVGLPAVVVLRLRHRRLSRPVRNRGHRPSSEEPRPRQPQSDPCSTRSSGANRFLRLAAAGGAFLVALVYLTSWSVFRDTGQFLDHNSVRMSQADPLGMLLHAIHMRPWDVILGCVSAVLFAVAAYCIVPRQGHAIAPFRSVKTVATMRYLFLFALAGALWGHLVPNQSQATRIDSETGISYPLSEVYAEERDNRSGPMSHGLADLRDVFGKLRKPEALGMPDFSTPEQLAALRIRRSPQITFEQYHARVSDSQVRPYNVIVLLVESLRPDQLQSCGGVREVMPHVDSVARESLVFRNAYTQASHSNYADMCPLSSHYPLRENGIHVYPSNPPYPRVLIYDVLKTLGYRTAVFSSQNENWGQMVNYLTTDHLDHFLHAANYTGPTYVCPEDVGFFEWAQGGKKCGKIDDRITVDEAIRWIEQDQATPFCIYMNLQNSHIPYVVPPDFPRRFSTSAPDFTIGFNSFPPDKAPQVRDAYADSLAYIDHQVGRFIDFLKRSGQWDHTVLVISGDTGQAFYEHGFAAHANKLYDEVMRVPLIIRVPEFAGHETDRLAQHIDVPPTLLAVLGLPPHPSFQGRNLLDPPQSSDAAFLVVQSPLADQVAMVQGDYKLIYDVPTQRFHLYDLKADPGEHQDIASNRPDITRALAAVLRRWCQCQLGYYADPAAQRGQFPPVLENPAFALFSSSN